jgi:hypothetical protein
MKQYLYNLILILITLGWHANAQTRLTDHKWTATLKVVDETGQPVSGAEAWVSFYLPPTADKPTDNGDKIKGVTDINGMFTASHTDRSEFLGFHVQSKGYYATAIEYALSFESQGDPSIWNPDKTLVLKRMRNPIPMYAKSVDLKVPIQNKPVGFDLMAGDWVPPYGKGIRTDILLTKEHEEIPPADYYSKTTISFPNVGDGIQVANAPAKDSEGSQFRSQYEAPATDYQPELVREIGSRPRKFDYDENRIYFLRVHTILDDMGNVKSALYGKIYGDFMQFRYYINPTPNDRNIEFDPGQNLFKHLKPLDQVDSP